MISDLAPPLTALQKLFFGAGWLLPLPSILLYVTVPSGTVAYFGGKPTPSASFWCSLAASGDAVVSVLCFAALRSKSLEVRKLVLRSNVVYSFFHFGAFWYHHTYTEPHPKGGYGYPVAMALSVAACAKWGR